MKLTLEHLDYCARHRAECYGESFEVSRDKLRNKILNQEIGIIVEGAGYIILRKDYDNPECAHVSAVLVEKKLQGKGYGGKILRIAEKECSKKGFKGITLSVRPRGEESIHSFYLKNGYSRYKTENNRVYYLKKIK